MHKKPNNDLWNMTIPKRKLFWYDVTRNGSGGNMSGNCGCQTVYILLLNN